MKVICSNAGGPDCAGCAHNEAHPIDGEYKLNKRGEAHGGYCSCAYNSSEGGPVACYEA